MENFLFISFGAVLGANARYWLGLWAVERFGSRFPWGTMAINLTGSFLLGLFVSIATYQLNLDPRWRLFIAVGFLGAYTTFSTYTFESVNLMLTGHAWLGLLSLLGSSILGAIFVFAGLSLGRSF